MTDRDPPDARDVLTGLAVFLAVIGVWFAMFWVAWRLAGGGG